MMTLIVPESVAADERFVEVGRLIRIEADTLVIGYSFDLRTNELKAEKVPNPRKGTEHRFIAFRLKSQAAKPVSMLSRAAILETVKEMEEE